MTVHTLLMSNLGYLRGINGKLVQHLLYAHRHIYCSAATQKQVLQQLVSLIETYSPDICCFVEIDKGSSNSANFNQLQSLINERYSFFDIENKYGEKSRLRTLSLTRGKSNAFIARKSYPFEKLSFTHGTKRLIYKIHLQHNITLFFAHFSLKKTVREHQLMQVKQLMNATPGESIFLGDFNILEGLQELAALLDSGDLVLLNEKHSFTFTFHRTRRLLDLCICTKALVPELRLKVIPQAFSDHDALLLEINN